MGAVFMTLCFLVCEHLHADMTAAAQAQGLTGIELRAFPARCGGPPLSAEELTELAAQSNAEEKEFFGCGCIGQEIEIPGCRIRRLEQCFHLLISPTLADALQRSGACLLTSGWLACWRQELNEEKGLGVFWNKMILLDTKADPQAEQHLAELAACLHLPMEIMPVGLGYAGLFLAAAAGEHRQKKLQRQEEESRRQAAESAMTLDMLGLVVKAASEAEVLDGIAELFRMLFAPKEVHCLPVVRGGLTSDRLAVLTPEERQSAEELLTQSERQHELTASGDGFFLRLGTDSVTSVLVLVRQVTFPQHLYSYINTALNVAGVCALAVEHVRILKKLLDTSRLAGKAEVATEVLHNVGNTFNSISVASERLREMLRQSGCVTLPPIIKLIEEHQDNLSAFCSTDPRGQKLPRYFASLSGRLMQERELMLEEVGQQLRHIRRAAEIIRTQQDTARGKGFVELLDLPAVLEESLDIFSKKIIERQIIVARDYAVLPPIRGERHKILQIVGNLISNAAEAFDGLEEREKKITLRLYPAGGSKDAGAVLEVEDNGKGITKAFMERIFQFGFSGKEGGHGFGLHNAANLAAEMDGSLRAESAGKDKGAIFRLLLPTVADRRRQ
ncbi:histidine kinase [Candidatus Electronema halotolerans]